MSRERDRIAKKMEKNPVVECNKIQKKFYPELFKKFEQITDPRNKSYIEYSARGNAWNDLLQRNCRHFQYAGDDKSI